MSNPRKPTKKWIDKNTANTYKMVYRSHEDSRFFDDEANEHILVPLSKGNSKNKHVKTRTQLEVEFESDLKQGKIRGNEGQAALYGISYDDSKYDYMQHLKPIGESQDGVFLAKKEDEKLKRKQQKQNEIDLMFKEDYDNEDKNDRKDELLLPFFMRSDYLKDKNAYQKMQNIPDEIAGLKPDMDENLREVLVALDDVEYVDDDEDIFNNLIKSGVRANNDGVDEYGKNDNEFDDWDYDTEGDMDHNEKYIRQVDEQFEKYENKYSDIKVDDFENDEELVQQLQDLGLNTNDDSGDWNYVIKHNKLNKEEISKNYTDSEDDFEPSEISEEENETVGELPKFPKKISKLKQRKKMGTKTDTSGYSMSSSANFRSKGLQLLDDRFAHMQQNYNDDSAYLEDPEEFDMSKERHDFELMLDDFLENHELEKGGRRIVKKDAAKARLQAAADSVSKGKHATMRNINRLKQNK